MKQELRNDCIEEAISMQVNGRNQENYKHYAFVIQNGRIVSYGCNTRVTHKTIYTRVTPDGQTLYSLHAEFVAYQKAKKSRMFNIEESFDMLVLRLNNHLRLMDSKPCRICENFLCHTSCRRVYYSKSGSFTIEANDYLTIQ